MKIGKVHYFNPGPFPVHVGFTICERAFQRELKRLNVTQPVNFLGRHNAGATTHLFERNGKDLCAIVCLGQIRKRTISELAAMIAHEAVHVAEAVFDSIGDKNPSEEVMAYMVQWVVIRCLPIVIEARR